MFNLLTYYLSDGSLNLHENAQQLDHTNQPHVHDDVGIKI